MTDGAHTGPVRSVVLATLLAVPPGLAGCAKKDLVIPNVTHINGIPIEEYDPDQFDPKQDNVFSVAPVTQAQAVPATTAAATSATTATAAQATAPAPDPAPEPEPAPESAAGAVSTSSSGNISVSTLVEGQPVQVTVMDATTTASVASQAGVPGSSALGAVEAESAIRVTGIGAKDIVRAIRGYSKICDIGYEEVVDWINRGGRVTEVSQSFDYLFWTDVCPGVAKYTGRR